MKNNLKDFNFFDNTAKPVLSDSFCKGFEEGFFGFLLPFAGIKNDYKPVKIEYPPMAQSQKAIIIIKSHGRKQKSA